MRRQGAAAAQHMAHAKPPRRQRLRRRAWRPRTCSCSGVLRALAARFPASSLLTMNLRHRGTQAERQAGGCCHRCRIPLLALATQLMRALPTLLAAPSASCTAVTCHWPSAVGRSHGSAVSPVLVGEQLSLLAVQHNLRLGEQACSIAALCRR